MFDRSHTDPLSNLVVLRGIDAATKLPEMVERDFPIETLPTFLHEVTHHWTFDTPVGLALSLLNFRARRCMVNRAAEAFDDDVLWRAIDSVARYDVALDFLRPFSEGLALFAEHDAIPGDTKVVSRPMELVAALYGRGLVSRSNDWSKLGYLLAGARISRPQIRRKAGVYLEPFDTNGGGYLPGYLSVKQLWRRSLFSCPEYFLDTDFFLGYLRWYFFNDWGLVSVLLDPVNKDVGAAERVLDYLVRRFAALIDHGVTKDDCENYEKQILDRSLPTHEVDFGYFQIGITAHTSAGSVQENDEGLSRVRAIVEELFKAIPDDDRMRFDYVTAIQSIAQRHFINIAHFSAELECDNKMASIRFDGEGRWQLPINRFERFCDDTSGELSFDLVASDFGILGLVITRGHELIGHFSFGGFEMMPNADAFVVNQKMRAEDSSNWRQLLESYIEAADDREVILTLRGHVAQSSQNFYEALGLLSVEKEKASRLAKQMRKNGFLDLDGVSLRMLLDLSAISYVLPSRYDFGCLRGVYDLAADRVEHSIGEINSAFSENLGVAPFMIKDEKSVPFSLV